MANRNAGLADLAARNRSIGVVAVLGREVECDREAFLAGFEILMKALVGLARIAKAGVGSDDPWLAFGRGLVGFGSGLGHRWSPAVASFKVASAGELVQSSLCSR